MEIANLNNRRVVALYVDRWGSGCFKNESDTNKLRFLASIGYSRGSGFCHAALHCRTS
jgi:hypothetical protein